MEILKITRIPSDIEGLKEIEDYRHEKKEGGLTMTNRITSVRVNYVNRLSREVLRMAKRPN